MTTHQRDLMYALGHFGPPPEPLWLPWHSWSLPLGWGRHQARVVRVRA